MVNLKLCNYCEKEVNVKGFYMHEKFCKLKHELEPEAELEQDKIDPVIVKDFRSRYANKLKVMTPMARERYVIKALGLPWDRRKYKEEVEV